jgi:uncharacterized protein YyaL (SSP411 family)
LKKTLLNLLVVTLTASLVFPVPGAFAKTPSVMKPTANRLITEKSPYLLQHAHNPVDWYPWGEEAFNRARKEGKLVFLSIGYSTCHWCHVMAHESFEDDEVAALLNRDFIAIKVDREERPDIDQVYMQVCRKLTGSGGWPLTIIMTPESVPVYAATFVPKNDRYGRTGMMNLLPQITSKWQENPEHMRQSGQNIIDALQASSSPKASGMLELKDVKAAVDTLRKSFDHEHGGFGNAPKFPRPHSLTFLLKRYRQTGDTELLKMVEATLQAMRRGGIYDHVGFGFHRYSTDAEWLVPHFEKMLYDQAGLAMAYAEAYQVTGHQPYAQTLREIFTYLLRDMTSSQGGFYAAEDADSEGVEGKFYLWSLSDIEKSLGKAEAARFQKVFNVTADGNYYDEATGEETGSNILHLTRTPEEWAEELGQDKAVLSKTLERNRVELFATREQRVRPHLDDKVITAWNGLMVSALARGGLALDEPQYVATASLAADFLLESLRSKDGRLLRRYRQGDAAIPAFAEDYAFLARGLLDLYAAGFDSERLEQALSLAKELNRLFQDAESGVLYDTATDAESLIMRPQSAYDGALPAASSVALELYARLYLLTGDPQWQKHADRLLAALAPTVQRYPAGYAQLLQGAALLMEPSREVVIAGAADDPATAAMLAVVRSVYAPETVSLLRATGHDKVITQLASFVAWMPPVNGKTAAYVCQNFSCQKPLTDPEELRRILERPPETRHGKQGEERGNKKGTP